MAANLKEQYGEEYNEIIEALIENPDLDTFMLEWDLLQFEKIKKLTDDLISEGSISI